MLSQNPPESQVLDHVLDQGRHGGNLSIRVSSEASAPAPSAQFKFARSLRIDLKNLTLGGLQLQLVTIRHGVRLEKELPFFHVAFQQLTH